MGGKKKSSTSESLTIVDRVYGQIPKCKLHVSSPKDRDSTRIFKKRFYKEILKNGFLRPESANRALKRKQPEPFRQLQHQKAPLLIVGFPCPFGKIRQAEPRITGGGSTEAPQQGGRFKVGSGPPWHDGDDGVVPESLLSLNRVPLQWPLGRLCSFSLLTS